MRKRNDKKDWKEKKRNDRKDWKGGKGAKRKAGRKGTLRTARGIETIALRHELEEEKLLSGSNESLNLLQYVSDFRTKPFRACDLARITLSSSQKSKKKKYDVDAVKRSFKPAQKVLAWLPVPGSSLNSMSFGPYVIQKKLSNLHVNMLQPCVEGSSDLVFTACKC